MGEVRCEHTSIENPSENSIGDCEQPAGHVIAERKFCLSKPSLSRQRYDILDSLFLVLTICACSKTDLTSVGYSSSSCYIALARDNQLETAVQGCIFYFWFFSLFFFLKKIIDIIQYIGYGKTLTSFRHLTLPFRG